MSLFKSSETINAADLHDKILFWGPQHTGKTHTLLSWPRPVLIDVENRAAHFHDRFTFLLAECQTIKQIAEACEEIQRGSLPGDTIGVDSGTAIYYKFVELYTTLNTEGKPITDWVAVNRRFLSFMNFVFGIAGKNVIFTAHAGEKLVRQGRDFTKAGQQFIGDQRFRYAFDYVFRIESKGDPRSNPAVFHVEKSASPHLKVGQQIVGLDYHKFIALTRPQKKAEAPPLKGEALADAQARGDAPTRSELLAANIAKICSLVAEHGIAQTQIAAVVKDVTRGKQTDYTKVAMLEEAEEIAARIVRLKERRAS